MGCFVVDQTAFKGTFVRNGWSRPRWDLVIQLRLAGDDRFRRLCFECFCDGDVMVTRTSYIYIYIATLFFLLIFLFRSDERNLLVIQLGKNHLNLRVRWFVAMIMDLWQGWLPRIWKTPYACALPNRLGPSKCIASKSSPEPVLLALCNGPYYSDFGIARRSSKISKAPKKHWKKIEDSRGTMHQQFRN